MELKDLAAEAVMERMNQQQPNWWQTWADQRDLQEALDMPPERQRSFLRGRCGDRVMLVLRSAYVEISQ